MIEVVFDCVTFVQAALSRKGAAYSALLLAEEKQFQILLTASILDELSGTLRREEMRRRYATLTEERVDSFLRRVAAVCHLVAAPPHVFSLPRDPKDEHYLDLAIERKAFYLVTWDKDLLSLMQEVEFKRAYPDLSIVNPTREFLRLMRAAIARGLGYE